jgi:hypothetical protein
VEQLDFCVRDMLKKHACYCNFQALDLNVRNLIDFFEIRYVLC